MELQTSVVASSDKLKKTVSFKSFLEAKRIDKVKVREDFLENCSNIPQELRLVFWKIFLGISNSFQSQSFSSDKLLEDHYFYLKNTLTKSLEIGSNRPEEMNFFIYLLDRGELPLYGPKLNEGHPFCLLYKQMCDILDDQSDFESYYLTSELYEYLLKSLNDMKSKYNVNLPKDIPNRAIIDQINIDMFLLSGLACLFRDVKVYHIIWDRLIMDENEFLVFMLIGFLETCKEEHLKTLLTLTYSNLGLVQKFALDESKIVKRAIKFYKSFRSSNQLISNMIVNYFNTK